jgi:redox-sensitive bicupin YhaK (pirin superfamily)
MHEEMPRRAANGKVNGFQLWVNLPAALKMSPPRYQEVTSSTIPVIDQNGVKVRVVAGEYGGVQGPVTEIAAQPLYMDVIVENGAEFVLQTLEGHFVVAYVFDGDALISTMDAVTDRQVSAVSMVVFDEGDHVRIRAVTGASARLMLMAGAPIHEPIFPYGPFVMNTEAEIRQTLADLRNGTFIQERPETVPTTN